MHTNHRRKTPKHANEKYLAPGSWHRTVGDHRKDLQRFYWKKDRLRVRTHLLKGRWDAIYTRPRHSVLWDLH